MVFNTPVLWNNTHQCIMEITAPQIFAGEREILCIELTEQAMFKKLFIATLLMLPFISTNAQDGQKVTSKVQKVVVFLTGGQVTRTATVSVKPGNSTLIFGDISPDIDAQSVQVHASGPFTILSVKQELNFLNEQGKQKRIEDLRAQQKALTDKIQLQKDMLEIYVQAEGILQKNQLVKADNANLDLIKLKQALDFHTAELTDLKKKEQAQNQQIAALNVELQKYNKQIADISRGSSNITNDILVNVSSATAVQAQFTISYVVRNAGWYPTYDIRAKDVNSPLSVSYKANVSQQCGEEWKDIKLTLSTGNPTTSGSKLVISPYLLNYGMYYNSGANAITRVTGRITAADDGSALPGVTVKIKGTSIGTQSDANGNYSLQVPPANPTLMFSFVGFQMQEQVVNRSVINAVLKSDNTQLNEVVIRGYVSRDVPVGSVDQLLQGKVAGLNIQNGKAPTSIPIGVQETENQTNVEFNIANPFSVPGDGKQYTVEINQLDLDAIYEYSVAPKLSTDVFLTAKLTDWNKYNFLSGEANLFFEGTYIGKSLIDTHTSNDTLNLSLGTDKNIVVTRTLQTNLTEKQSLGSNKKETKNWVIEVRNRKSQAINLLVEDQVPVSQNSAIEVDTQEISGGKLEPLTGKITWNLALKPLDNKKIELKYQVRYPKNQTVIVQ